MSDLDPYAVLGVRRDASPSEVSSAYRHLARRHHPDVSRDADAERRMAEINDAWAILRDARRRAAWNRAHGQTASTFGSPAPAARRPASTRTTAKGSAPAPAIAWRRGPNGEGAAGPPPGNPRGSVVSFGRHIGWSLGEIARVDPGYLVWLAEHREGAPYRSEIDGILAAMRRKNEPEPAAAATRRGRRPFG